jgi:hypothetical protein
MKLPMQQDWFSIPEAKQVCLPKNLISKAMVMLFAEAPLHRQE